MVFYAEWAPKVNARKGRMVTLEALETICKQYDPGYSSVYWFSEEVAKEISEKGSSSGLNQYPVSSNCLTMDLDGGEEALYKCLKVLDKHNLAYTVYSSGGKGFHVTVPHALVTSVHLPYSHQKAVEELGIETDLSLYQHGRILSLVGRVHPKTGVKKHLIFSKEGEQLDLKIVYKPTPTFSANFGSDINALFSGLDRFTNLTKYEPTPGNRHSAIWGASKDLAEAGLQFDTILDIALAVNNGWKNPKTEDEIKLAVEQAVGK